jgi:hypothetical protein
MIYGHAFQVITVALACELNLGSGPDWNFLTGSGILACEMVDTQRSMLAERIIVEQYIRKHNLPEGFLDLGRLYAGKEEEHRLVDVSLENYSSQQLVDKFLELSMTYTRDVLLRILIYPLPIPIKKLIALLKYNAFETVDYFTPEATSALVLCRSRRTRIITSGQYSAIIPCRNEGKAVRRIPELFAEVDSDWELIFIEGNSSDNTWEVLQQIVAEPPAGDNLQISAFQQTQPGKAGAVFEGFERASGNISFIYDGDATVRIRDILMMCRALERGEADFCNGDRFFFRRAKLSMRSLNRLGNAFFGLCYGYVTGRYFRDVFCGTKAFRTADWPHIKKAKEPFEKYDRYGDFQLLFAAHALGMIVTSHPVHYLARVAGQTTLHPFEEGKRFLRTAFHAWRYFRRKAR